MLLQVRKEEGFVRTQTQIQTITVASADCLCATRAVVKCDDWYKVLCVSHAQPSKSQVNNDLECFLEQFTDFDFFCYFKKNLFCK